MTIKDRSKALYQHLYKKSTHKLVFNKNNAHSENDTLAKLFMSTQRINKVETDFKTENKLAAENLSSVEEIFGIKRRLSQFTYKNIDNQKNKNYRNRNILPSLEEVKFDDNGKRLSWSRPSLIKLPNVQEQINLRKMYNENLLRARMEEKILRDRRPRNTRLSTYLPHDNVLDSKRKELIHNSIYF